MRGMTVLTEARQEAKLEMSKTAEEVFLFPMAGGETGHLLANRCPA